MYCTTNVAVNPNPGGGSETWGMRGKCVDGQQQAIEGAVVVLYDALDSSGPSAPIALAIDTTDTAGLFMFDTAVVKTSSLFNVNADYNDGELVAFIQAVERPDSQVDLGMTVLKAPGGIAGTVLTDDTSHAGTRCYIPGTSWAAFTDDDGGFEISTVPEGTYRVYFDRESYLRAWDTAVQVVSGQVVTLPPVTLERDPAAQIPTPGGVSIEYDSIAGVVTVRWNAVHVSDIAGYDVYVDSGFAGPRKITPAPVADTFFVDTVRIYSNSESPCTLSYQVKSVDNSSNESQYSQQVTALVYPRLEPDTWAQGEEMTAGRRFLFAVTLDNRIYAMGGEESVFSGTRVRIVPLVTVEEFDPATSSWAQLDPLRTARYSAAAAACGTRIYVFGGGNYRSDITVVEAFNPETGAFDSVAAAPRALIGCAAACVDGMIYLIGGDISTPESFEVSDAIIRFDPSTLEFTPVASLAEARCYHQAVAEGGKVYVMGGINYESDRPMGSVEIFDPAAGTVTRGPSMITRRCNFAAASCNGKIYVFGGLETTLPVSILQDVEEYDPQEDTWTQKSPMMQPRHAMAATEHRGKIYVIGGTVDGYSQQGQPISESAAVEIYSP
jgi:N-acetylneuraminic acid mutarotase